MSDPDLGFDPHRVRLASLKKLYRNIDKLHQSGGGYGRFLLILKAAINTHPENPKKQDYEPEANQR